MKLKGYPKNFWLICVSLLFFMISFNIILPELNAFITNLGGEGLKGNIIAFFTISAAVSRPFSGKLSDTIGRKKVMFLGLIAAFIVTLIYPLSTLVTFLVLRFLHGFSAGFLPTGATALVTDILPEDRRGIGMGIWGTFTAVGIGAGQIFSKDIVEWWGMNGLFMVAAIFVLLSGILIAFVKETLENPQSFKWSLLRITIDDVFEPHVRPAAVVMFASAISTGIVFVVTPDMAEFLELDNKGWFFGYYMFSTIVVRLFASSLSDVIGRRKTLIIGMLFMAAGMATLAFSTNSFVSITGAILFGMATGISSPSLFAWTADLSPAHRRGVGAGTLFIALEIGVMVGSFSTLITYDNTARTIPVVFLFGAFFALLSVLYLIWHLAKRSSKT